jgi:hypothetical protein
MTSARGQKIGDLAIAMRPISWLIDALSPGAPSHDILTR